MKRRKFKHIATDFIEKMRFQYRVSIMNENTLEESWHTRLSRFSVFIYGTSLFLTTFILLTILIFLTPLKHYLPGYGDSGNRSLIVQNSLRTDSIAGELEHQQEYLSVLKDIIAGTPKTDTIKSLDSVGLKERATVLSEKSKQEKEFIKNYEESEKYNLSEMNNVSNEKRYVFFRPVTGVVASTFDPQEGKFGISVITSPQENVLSVLEGTIVNAAFTFDYGWIISVQHDNDYLSIYKNNNKLLKRIGDFVKAGESIAVTGNEDGKKSGNHFYFELWQKGKPIDPQSVIAFRF
ncbi:Peptidase M23 [uncultured Paludibacter sp.]|uniref:Peptidase M23 n=1 Tax=uncultured Paludibacter sp. TaxID=497635 RepID=A0A653AJ84_9BACT|nr:Peptidase M23 [uncultured Paludibacter sp.]